MIDNLYQAWAEDRELMFSCPAEIQKLGEELARAEAEYQQVKARVALRMKLNGETATYIQMVIKGDDEVNEALFRRDCAQSNYEAAKESLNVYKLDLRVVEAQIEREFRS